MPLIDGVGDEVIQFVAVIVVVIVAALAWWSTNARPDRYRTVLVMRSRAHRPVTVSIRRTNSIVPRRSNSVHASTSISIGTNTPTPEIVPSRASQENTQVIPLQEMDSIVDADMAMMDNNRLHFYRMIDSPNTSQRTTESQSEETEAHEESEPASNAQIREMDSIVSAMEADVTAGCDFFTRATQSRSALTSDEKNTTKENKKPSNPTEESNPEDGTKTETSDAPTEPLEGNPETQNGDEADQHTVLIKLKYLNDTLKEVQCNLDDLLKDFKLRHFSRELSSQCRVVLIFRGRELGDEAATLRACGLHHHAVVHCLVHPNRGRSRATPFAQSGALPESATTNDTTHELVTESPAAGERVWDLENILMTLVSVALTVVWFFRCEYSSMFTASASVALFGLTVFYSVAIFGLYLSDAFHFERRPNAQLAN